MSFHYRNSYSEVPWKLSDRHSETTWILPKIRGSSHSAVTWNLLERNSEGAWMSFHYRNSYSEVPWKLSDRHSEATWILLVAGRPPLGMLMGTVHPEEPFLYCIEFYFPLIAIHAQIRLQWPVVLKSAEAVTQVLGWLFLFQCDEIIPPVCYDHFVVHELVFFFFLGGVWIFCHNGSLSYRAEFLGLFFFSHFFN